MVLRSFGVLFLVGVLVVSTYAKEEEISSAQGEVGLSVSPSGGSAFRVRDQAENRNTGRVGQKREFLRSVRSVSAGVCHTGEILLFKPG